MHQQQQYYKTKYRKLQQLGKIQISNISTYQGRLEASVSGCTVILALTVAHHLQNPDSCTTISSEAIENVINVQCSLILHVIRNKLSLDKHAMIIPSDVI
jgi:hypothetical protein